MKCKLKVSLRMFLLIVISLINCVHSGATGRPLHGRPAARWTAFVPPPERPARLYTQARLHSSKVKSVAQRCVIYYIYCLLHRDPLYVRLCAFLSIYVSS